MADVPLTFAIGSRERVQPIIDGTVRPAGIDLQVTVDSIGDIFWTMPQTEPWDVAEMSITGFLWAIQHGRRWVALPVFPGWVFGCHADTLVNVDAGIERPEDLKDKRIGVPEYAVTAIAWIRDAWEQEYGVRRQDVRWFDERTEQSSHYRFMGYRPPATVSDEIIAPGKALCDMLIAGEIDAVTRYFGGNAGTMAGAPGERSPMTMRELAAHPKVRWLHPDRKATALEYHRKIGWPQPIHTIVVKQDVVDRHPWVPAALYEAFAEAARRTADVATVHTSFPFPAEEQRAAISLDFSPVGLSAGNRAVLARLLELAALDGFVVGDRKFTVDELFPEPRAGGA